LVWFGWRNRKKISQIVNDYLYLPFFLFYYFMISALSQLGALAVAVPGEVAGYWEAKQRSSFL
jgi:hypothetical protein